MDRDCGRALGPRHAGPDVGPDGLPGPMVTLPPDPSSPARARALIRRVLAAAQRLDCVDAAELACTELVTNAVLHAHTPIDVRVEVGDAVRVEVRDRSPSLPARLHYDPHATTGRGLALVAALADRYGVTDAGAEGKTMWFTVGAPAPERSDDELLSAWDAARWDVDFPAHPPAAGADRERTRDVHLLALPTALWLAVRQHHDALLRELALYAARHDDLAVDLVATDRARFALVGTVAVAVEQRLRTRVAADPAGEDASGAWQPVPVDLTVHLAADAGPDFAAMQDTLDVAEHLARAGRLLAVPGLPEVVAVRDWVCEQVVAQLAGVGPSRWPGTDQERFTDEVHGRDSESLDGVDLDAVRLSPGCVAAADDSNRILAVSEPLARLLGHQAEHLVGRRIVVLIPPRLREAHVAGFTRHLSTGEVHVIGAPVTVPVLRADGREITCRLLIERAAVARGRAMYLATFEPVEPEQS